MLPGAPARRFLVQELLGRGATATVFRATDLSDGRPVAVKVAEGPEPRQAKRIHAEARILASLDHPAIVTFIAEGVVPARCPGLHTSMRAGWSTATSNPRISCSVNCGAPRSGSPTSAFPLLPEPGWTRAIPPATCTT